MPPRDPLTYTKALPRLENMNQVFKRNTKLPSVGITQGGSSRKASGARVAATSGQIRQTQTGDTNG